jgi:tRNA pseudouridine13 synthase
LQTEYSQKLPFLTGEIDGIGGVIKSCNEDFIVEEVPLYQPSGQGTHVYAQIEKKGITTYDAIAKIARAVNKQSRDIGFAGLKDANAITRQWISIEHIDPEKLNQIDIPNIKILQLARHGNKLKLGHLSGNRFAVRIRNIAVPFDEAVKKTQQILAILVKKGVPNYFGPQRFGNRGNNFLLGKALLNEMAEEFIDLFLGRPEKDDSSTINQARSFYEQGLFEKAHAGWPYQCADERRALKTLIKTNSNKKKAFSTIGKQLRMFFTSAYQSYIFNRVLSARMPDIDRLLLGDMAYKHINGACFKVEDAAAEQARCDNFEISPTGPLFGERMTKLTGPAGEIENPILADEGLEDTDTGQIKYSHARGGRRALRFGPRNCEVSKGCDKNGDYLELHFEIDSGCYATVLVREITKTDF